jgi:hypothetical protein
MLSEENPSVAVYIAEEKPMRSNSKEVGKYWAVVGYAQNHPLHRNPSAPFSMGPRLLYQYVCSA